MAPAGAGNLLGCERIWGRNLDGIGKTRGLQVNRMQGNKGCQSIAGRPVGLFALVDLEMPGTHVRP